MTRTMIRAARSLLAGALVLTAATAVTAADYHPAFKPGALKGRAGATPNEVMVLGTPHLSGMPDSFAPAMLEPLIDRLAAWAPTAIATEDLSGLHCDTLRRYPARYAQSVEYYCADPAPAARATGLDVPAANAEVERLLASWPAIPTVAQRRHLAALFLAAGERGSALVQWLRLPPGDRVAGDGLNTELVAELDRLLVRRNESGLIAAVLAARLGHERLWSVDDHSADSPGPGDPAESQAQSDAIARAWDNPATKARGAADARLNAGLSKPGGLLAYYRAYNHPKQAMLVYRSDFGAAMQDPSPQGFGRNYVAYWEVRNMRMVANMLDVLGRKPGTRMLMIVGASHKAYLEAYLDQSHDVRLVNTASLLRD